MSNMILSKMIIKALFIIFCLINLSSCSNEKTPINKSDLFGYQQYIMTQGLPPAEYVMSKFADHQVIFIGEYHRIKSNPLLIQQLIPLMYADSIFTLATEYANKADQPLIDSLLNALEWNEELAREIQLRHYSLWPWREYLDIYKIGWELNNSLPENAKRFRILGINCSLDWSPVTDQEKLNDPKIRRAVWKGCSEESWADVIMEPVSDGEKVLVYSGSHHAFTKYRQPIVDDKGKFIRFGDTRVGNHVYNQIVDQAMTIFIHSPWYDKNSQYNNANHRPMSGAIDQVMASLGDRFQATGFDVLNSPFGKITDDAAIYSVGYKDFSLADFCDGYIYFEPFNKFETVTYIEGFYTDENIELARKHVPQPLYRTADITLFEKNMKSLLLKDQKKFGSM